MRRFVQGLLVLGMAVLSSTAQAQYAPQGYYYPPQQMPAYAPVYPYAGMAAPVRYYQPYAQPTYAPPIVYYNAPQAYYPAPVRPVSQVSRPTTSYKRAVPAPRPAPAPMPAGDAVEEDGDTEEPDEAVAEPAPRKPAQRVRSTVAGPQKTAARVGATAIPAPEKLEAKPAVQTASGASSKRFIDRMLPSSLAPKEGAEALPDSADGAATDDPNCPTGRRQRFQFFGEALYWNLHNSGVPFAQAFDGVDPFLSVPRGPVGVAELGYNAGYRAGAGLSLNEHSWVVGTFTYFQDNTQAHLEAPDGNVLHSNVIFPNTANAAFAPLVADADYNVRLFTGDIDYKCSIVDNDCLKLNWLAGARFGRITQAFNAQYEEILGVDTVRSTINFNGVGPRAGIEGEYKIAGGLFGYGKGALDLLAGRFGGTYEQRDVFGGLVARTEISEKRLVPVTEFEMGGGWQSARGMIRVSGGYYVGSWFNTLTTQGLIRGIQNNDFTTNGDNFRDVLSFDGLVGRIEFRY